jgi:serine-type D-Ala-D-Ala carboxypeptidase/endopeptidase (penicillin-binding protein 4)
MAVFFIFSSKKPKITIYLQNETTINRVIIKKNMQMKFLYVLPFILLAFFSHSERLSSDEQAENQETPVHFQEVDSIEDAILKLKEDNQMQGSQWSFCAYNLTQKKYIAEKDIHLRLVCASVLKVFTTLSAYDIVGHNHTFETRLMHNGHISDDGVLHGDIIISSNGDPTIACDYFGRTYSSAAILLKFTTAIQKANIRSIKGRIIGDASLWGVMLQAPGYMWEDLGNYYGAGASSLNYNENKLKVTFQPGKTIGDSAKLLSITPHHMDIDWDNMVTTAASNSGDNVYIYGTPLQKNRYLTGTVPTGRNEFVVWASDPDPALRFAADLHTALIFKGISISEEPISVYSAKNMKTDKTVLLETHYSPSIKSISKFVNHRSHNVSAESVFRHLGMKLGNTHNYEKTAELLLTYWKKRGVKTDEVIITDGSGLSRTNMLTTRFLVSLLIYAHHQPWFEDFYEILPIAGQDGTLRGNFKGTTAENNMRGKSGLLKGVRSYTGYLHNQSGDTIAFAVIVNGHQLSSVLIRQKVESLVAALSDSHS